MIYTIPIAVLKCNIAFRLVYSNMYKIKICLVDLLSSNSNTFATSMILSSQISNEMIELPPNSTVLLRFDNVRL